MELHHWLQQQAFFDFHRTHGIHVTQYSPFGNSNKIYGSREQHGLLVNDDTLVEIGKKYGKSSNQVALGMSAILSFEMELTNFRSLGYLTRSFSFSKSKSPERITQNFDIALELEPSDIEKINSIDKKIRFNDSSKDFVYELFTDLDGKQK
ncbi:uncharacterized protein N7529_008597 [Penicillium soppii]|jgi:diketogulonate reductase-like aldo/keto reductase|uniref:uncharacterized protein n=1 Tax=Penicillium soppii TaxID=69789 RepID=UPI0025476D14|nr:uncharacterized protein N7529_008597 [Penicillium soppii]KAJ5861287.1 hypothetical protein N7529_008597 [Penicillium soppii]